MAKNLMMKRGLAMKRGTTLHHVMTAKMLSTTTLPLSSATARPYDEIPRVPFVETVAPLLSGNLKRQDLPQFIAKRLQQYGPIYREKFPTQDEFVFTSNPLDWEMVFKETRHIEKSNSKDFLWGMGAYAKKKSLPDPYSMLDGEEFYERRDLIGKSLLQPGKVKEYVPMYSLITEDLINLLEKELGNQDNSTVTDIRRFIDRWQFECGGMVTFQKRLGFLDNKKEQWNPSAVKIFDSSKVFFETFPALAFGSPHHKLMRSKLWNDFEKCLDDMHEGAAELLDDDNSVKFLQGKTGVTKDIEINILVDVMRGSTDTVSHAVLWSLIELAKHPEIQDRICEELKPVLDQHPTLTYNILQKQSYLRGVMKEVFRLHPLTPLLIRKLDKDVVLDSGYHVPTGTIVAMTLSAYDGDKYFDDSHKMVPERWINSNKTKCPMSEQKLTPKFAVVPFGSGPRACIGRRTAENLLLVFIAKFLQKYKVVSTEGWVKAYNLFIHPKGPVNVCLVERE